MAGSMEGFKLGNRSAPLEPISEKLSSKASELSLDQARIFSRTSPRHVISLGTSSKLCAISFVVGVFVGFTLKRRLRLWASKLLKRIKDD
ncbi:hypothetical protein AXF42_Ash011499 [Apostasia shenzhenica]|uniref:Uncharacterized protein n=1 Tax=Apostasia shenzhenica TaxID=1088818 RepID=A0A2I0BAS6_9ASPA|nr:hypothetical protein AXF42_Ash011499 [Apostasia shenzhenica]